MKRRLERNFLKEVSLRASLQETSIIRKLYPVTDREGISSSEKSKFYVISGK